MVAPRVLFLCTHNSARSQMAEALLRVAGRGIEAESAGTEATEVRPLALEALREIGIDASAQTSKTLDRFLDQSFDFVITVCDAANDACPTFPNAARREHWSLPDPSRATGTREEQLQAYRDVRDDLELRIADLVRRMRADAGA
jgi:arsenate reductase